MAGRGARLHGVGDGDSLQDWFKSIPLVTKFLVTSTLLSGAGVSFGLLSPRQLFFAWPLVHQKFHIWRLVTPFLFAGTFSFNFLMHLVILYENCKRYERNPFSTGAGGTSADFLWMVIVGMGIFCVVGCYFELGFMSEQLLYLIMYVWSRREPDTILSFFGFKFKALYVPWVYMAFRLLMGGDITGPLMGVAVGHLYYFLVDVLPISHGYDLVKTPRFCIQIVNWYTGGSSTEFRVPPVTTEARNTNPRPGSAAGFPQMGAGYNWTGRGRTLGTS